MKASDLRIDDGIAFSDAAFEIHPFNCAPLEHWTTFVEYLSVAGSVLRASAPAARSRLSLAFTRKASACGQSFPVRMRSTTAIGPRAGHDRSRSSRWVFRSLQVQKNAIEARFGEPLISYEAEAQHRRRIFVRLPANVQERPTCHANTDG